MALICMVCNCTCLRLMTMVAVWAVGNPGHSFSCNCVTFQPNRLACSTAVATAGANLVQQLDEVYVHEEDKTQQSIQPQHDPNIVSLQM
eukprot:3967258-Amphidinium_carterae.1